MIRFVFPQACAGMFWAPPPADSDGESDGSDQVPVPNFQNSFSQGFEAALSQLDHGHQTSAQAIPISGESFCSTVLEIIVVMTRINKFIFDFLFRGERREEKEEKAEAAVQHFYGSHKVNGTEVYYSLLSLPSTFILPTITCGCFI